MNERTFMTSTTISVSPEHPANGIESKPVRPLTWGREVLRSSSPISARRLITPLQAAANKDGTRVHPGYARLAKEARMRRSGVSDGLRWLEENGYLQVTRKGHGAARLATEYMLTMPVQSIPKVSQSPSQSIPQSIPIDSQSIPIGSQSIRGDTTSPPHTSPPHTSPHHQGDDPAQAGGVLSQSQGEDEFIEDCLASINLPGLNLRLILPRVSTWLSDSGDDEYLRRSFLHDSDYLESMLSGKNNPFGYLHASLEDMYLTWLDGIEAQESSGDTEPSEVTEHQAPVIKRSVLRRPDHQAPDIQPEIPTRVRSAVHSSWHVLDTETAPTWFLWTGYGDSWSHRGVTEQAATRPKNKRIQRWLSQSEHEAMEAKESRWLSDHQLTG